jgi:hypothetical protein
MPCYNTDSCRLSHIEKTRTPSKSSSKALIFRPYMWWSLGMRMRSYGNMPPIALECLLSLQHGAAGNVRKWPFPAAQAMKFTRGRPTATCDPFWSLTTSSSIVGYAAIAFIRVRPARPSLP